MNQQMIIKIKKMQKEMQEAQELIESTVFKGSVTGVCSVEVMGTKEIKNITIDPSFSVEDDDDREVLNDSIVAACNQAYNDIAKFTEEKLGKYSAMLGGGGLF